MSNHPNRGDRRRAEARNRQDKAAQLIVQAINELSDDPDWAQKILALIGVANEKWQGFTPAPDGTETAEVERRFLTELCVLAHECPSDWIFRAIRFILLMDLQMKRPATEGATQEAQS